MASVNRAAYTRKLPPKYHGSLPLPPAIIAAQQPLQKLSPNDSQQRTSHQPNAVAQSSLITPPSTSLCSQINTIEQAILACKKITLQRRENIYKHCLHLIKQCQSKGINLASVVDTICSEGRTLLQYLLHIQAIDALMLLSSHLTNQLYAKNTIEKLSVTTPHGHIIHIIKYYHQQDGDQYTQIIISETAKNIFIGCSYIFTQSSKTISSYVFIRNIASIEKDYPKNLVSHTTQIRQNDKINHETINIFPNTFETLVHSIISQEKSASLYVNSEISVLFLQVLLEYSSLYQIPKHVIANQYTEDNVTFAEAIFQTHNSELINTLVDYLGPGNYINNHIFIGGPFVDLKDRDNFRKEALSSATNQEKFILCTLGENTISIEYNPQKVLYIYRKPIEPLWLRPESTSFLQQ